MNDLFFIRVVCYKMQSTRCGYGVKVEKFHYLFKVFFSSNYLCFLHNNIFKLLCFIPIFMTCVVAMRFTILQSYTKSPFKPLCTQIQFVDFQTRFWIWIVWFLEIQNNLWICKIWFLDFQTSLWIWIVWSLDFHKTSGFIELIIKSP